MNDTTTQTKRSWWQRLTGGLKHTSSALGSAISDLVVKRKLDAETIAGIKDVLIRADLGLETAERIGAALGQSRHAAEISPEEVKAVVATEIEAARFEKRRTPRGTRCAAKERAEPSKNASHTQVKHDQLKSVPFRTDVLWGAPTIARGGPAG